MEGWPTLRPAEKLPASHKFITNGTLSRFMNVEQPLSPEGDYGRNPPEPGFPADSARLLHNNLHNFNALGRFRAPEPNRFFVDFRPQER